MIFLIICLLFTAFTVSEPEKQFIYHGFRGSNLHLEGLAEISPDGLLQLTNTTKFQKGHAFYRTPLKFDTDLSFSTSFVFAIYPETDIPHSGHGIALVFAPSMDFSHAFPSEFLGIFNVSSNGLPTDHIFAVELDTVQNAIFDDIDGNHVGINVNSLNSVSSASAVYPYGPEDKGTILQLTSGKPMQLWIDYDEVETLVNVKLAPIGHLKPERSLLSARVNLSDVLLGSMYVGFSSSTGISTNRHYILGWSWNQSGEAQSLDPSKLPSLPPRPRVGHSRGPRPGLLAFLIIVVVILVVSVIGVGYVVRKKKYEEIYEVWEHEYAPNRLAYKDLYKATKGFEDTKVLGFGGFGKVYQGVLLGSNTQVAVKRVSHDSKQGLREFIAEIASMRRLRHRNLVQLLGYCRRKGELLLVYDYMPNGSLDKILFTNDKPILGWIPRLKIIKGVASALLYLHEEWEQVVLHRDVKASNVLLDANMDARLGDFGLARLYDHETGPQTTRLVGTLGYLAPELSRTGKPTTRTDVFAFGTFMLEVACGRRPIGLHSLDEESLVDWVFESWEKGEILKTCDSRLEGKYDAEEMKLVLKLGLLCCHVNPEKRPTMRQVMQSLEGNASIISANQPEVKTHDSTDSFMEISWPSVPFYLSSNNFTSAGSLSSDDSVLLLGR